MKKPAKITATKPATVATVNVTVNVAGARLRAERVIAWGHRWRVVRWLLSVAWVRWLVCRWAARGARVRIVGRT